MKDLNALIEGVMDAEWGDDTLSEGWTREVTRHALSDIRAILESAQDSKAGGE